MRQSLEWQLKKRPQAVVLETSVEFPLDFTGHSIQHSPTPDIFILQPAAVPVQKRQTVPQRGCAAWKKKKTLYRLKAGPKPHQSQREGFQRSQWSGSQSSVPRLAALVSAAKLGKMWLSAIQVWPNLTPIWAQGYFSQSMAQKGLSFQPFFASQGRQELQSMNQLVRRAPPLSWQCLQLLWQQRTTSLVLLACPCNDFCKPDLLLFRQHDTQ